MTPVADPEPLGQWGWMSRWDNESAAAGWALFARAQHWPVRVEIVPAYRSVAVIPVEKPYSQAVQRDLREWLDEALTRFARSGDQDRIRVGEKPVIEVPVIYDGPDLADVASRLDLTPEQVVGLHVSAVYQVFAVGFLPGFPYAGYLPEKLAGLPRRTSPRTKVPAGSVAIAGRQTGIYPCDSPGGWHILGRTPLEVCDLSRGFFRFEPADRIRFAASPGGVVPDRDQDLKRASLRSGPNE